MNNIINEQILDKIKLYINDNKINFTPKIDYDILNTYVQNYINNNTQLLIYQDNDSTQNKITKESVYEYINNNYSNFIPKLTDEDIELLKPQINNSVEKYFNDNMDVIFNIIISYFKEYIKNNKI